MNVSRRNNNNGKWMEYHPSFVYASDLYQEFPSELKAKMKDFEKIKEENIKCKEENKYLSKMEDELKELKLLIILQVRKYFFRKKASTLMD